MSSMTIPSMPGEYALKLPLATRNTIHSFLALSRCIPACDITARLPSGFLPLQAELTTFQDASVFCIVPLVSQRLSSSLRSNNVDR